MARSAVTLSMLLAACGPSVATGSGEGSDSGGSTGVGTGGSTVPLTASSTTGVADVTTDASTTAVVTTGDSSSSSGDDESTGPESVCYPQPEEVSALAFLDRDDHETETIAIDADCEIEEIVELEETVTRYVLSCAEATGDTVRTLELSADPAASLPLVVGASLHVLAHRTAYIDLPQRLYLALRDTRDELVLGYHGSLDVPDGVDVESWYAPFELAFDGSQCDPEPYRPPDSDTGSFLVDPCPDQVQRAAFMIRSPWAMGLVYDRGAAPFGEYEVRVSFAVTLIPHGDPRECPTTPRDLGIVVFLPNP